MNPNESRRKSNFTSSYLLPRGLEELTPVWRRMGGRVILVRPTSSPEAWRRLGLRVPLLPPTSSPTDSGRKINLTSSYLFSRLGWEEEWCYILLLPPLQRATGGRITLLPPTSHNPQVLLSVEILNINKSVIKNERRQLLLKCGGLYYFKNKLLSRFHA